MFDLAWSEIALILLVALVVIGPKDLPHAIRGVADFIRRARRMAGEFQVHVDEMMRESKLDEVKRQIDEVRTGIYDMTRDVERQIDEQDLRDAFKDPFADAAGSSSGTASWSATPAPAEAPPPAASAASADSTSTTPPPAASPLVAEGPPPFVPPGTLPPASLAAPAQARDPV